MACSDVWIRTDSKLIRADTVQAVAWNEFGAPEFLQLRASGETDPLCIQVEPKAAGRGDGPFDFGAHEQALHDAAPRIAGLDGELVRSMAAASQRPGGALIRLQRQDHDSRVRWLIEPLTAE